MTLSTTSGQMVSEEVNLREDNEWRWGWRQQGSSQPWSRNSKARTRASTGRPSTPVSAKSRHSYLARPTRRLAVRILLSQETSGQVWFVRSRHNSRN